MESDNNALAKMVQVEAKKSGISSKDAKKALKKLRTGGMAQIAPQLQSSLMDMNPNMTPKDKLRAKMRKMQDSRTKKQTKEQSYEKTRQEVYERQAREEEEKAEKKKAEIQRRKNHVKKIKLLEKQLGTITHEMYNSCMSRLKDNAYDNDGSRNRDRNIAELYGKQQAFASKIELNDMDDI